MPPERRKLAPACHAVESLAPMWIRLNDTLGHIWFNLVAVRKDG